MKRGIVTFVAMTMLVAACGGGGTDEPAPTSSTDARPDAGTQPPSADTSTTRPEAGEEPVASAEEGTGTATIGDMTWEFTTSGGFTPGMCDVDVNDAGVAFVVLMFGTDDQGREIAMNMGGPASGGDVRNLVQVGDPFSGFERWTADPTVYDEHGKNQGLPEGIGATVQIDGNTISGSGVFYDYTTLYDVFLYGGNYEAGVLKGTFSATCPAG